MFFSYKIIDEKNINLSNKIMKLQEDQKNFKFNMIKNQSNFYPSSKQTTQLNNNSSLLIPFDQSTGPNQLQYNNNANDLNKNYQINDKLIYNNKESYNLNKNIHNNTELSDSDDSDYVHVTFDLTENAANFLKKVDFQQLKEIGILSIKLNDEKTIKINSNDEKKNSKQNLTNNNNFIINDIKQERTSIVSNESLKGIQPSTYFQPTQTNLQTNNNNLTSIVPSVNSTNLISTPPARKRNRKTINELTNHLSTGNSYSNYSNEISNDETRNIKLNESSLEKNIGENSSSPHNTKRKRANKNSNDTSLDLNGSFNKTNELFKDQSEPLNISQEQNVLNKVETQFVNNNIIGSDLKQVYIIDKNIPTKAESQNFQHATSNSYIVAPFSRLNNSDSLQNQNLAINFSDNNLNDISRQKDTNQQMQMIHQQQNHQFLHQQQQHQIQYQTILNNQKLNQNSQQYKMPSPMLANILSNNEIINSNNYTQLNTNHATVNSNELYLLNNNNLNKNENTNQMINTMNPSEINKNNDISYSINNQSGLNKQYHSINELQLLKSEDYKQIYQIRQNLIANQTIQYNQMNINHIQNSNEQINQQPPQPVQLQNNIININQQQVNITKRRRLPADPSKTRAKRAKANQTDQSMSNNLLSSDISNQKDNSIEINNNNNQNINKTSVNLTTKLNIENNNISNMITLTPYSTNNYNDEKNIINISDYQTNKQNNDLIKLTNSYESSTTRFENPNFINPVIQNNNMDKYIDFSATNLNRDLIIKEQNTITKYECNSIGSSNNSNCGSNASIDSSPILKDKPKNNENIEENTSNKINIQLVGTSVNYSNQTQSLDNLNNGQQPSNLIYLNPTGIDKSKSLNFVSFKLSNNNNTGPVSSSFSSSSSYILEPNQNFKNNNTNLTFNNANANNNNFNSNNFTSLSSSSTASSSFQNLNNNYDLNKSNSPIHKDSINECISNGLQQQILNGNVLQYISTDDSSK
jgi:hypothetical protein